MAFSRRSLYVGKVGLFVMNILVHVKLLSTEAFGTFGISALRNDNGIALSHHSPVFLKWAEI